MSTQKEHGVIRDSATYREMAEPYETSDEADAALNAFFEELRELRKKHRIANTYTVAQVSALDDEGYEQDLITAAHNGDNQRVLAMVAWAFGREQKHHEQMVRRLATGA